MLQLKIEQQQDIGLAKNGKLWLEKEKKEKAQLIKQGTIPNPLCVKDCSIK